MAGKFSFAPWLSIWTRPRQTIRQIVSKNPKSQFTILSGVYGFPMLLHLAQNFSLGLQYSEMAILIGALVLCVFIGMLGISVGSALILWTGRWIGGKGSFQTIRSAVAWSNAPNIVNVVLWLILINHFRQALFIETFGQSQFAGSEMTFVSTIFILQTIVAIWSFVILLKTVGEVQGFSAWKGLLNVLIPFFIIGIAVWLISWLFWIGQGFIT